MNELYYVGIMSDFCDVNNPTVKLFKTKQEAVEYYTKHNNTDKTNIYAMVLLEKV